MKVIPLTDDSGNLVPNAYALWLVHKYLPDDEQSRNQLLVLYETERQRYLGASDDWQPTDLSRKVLEWLEARTGQVHAAGYVALALIFLSQNGNESPTLYAAGKLIERALAKLKEHDTSPFKVFQFSGEWEVRTQRLPTQEKQIRDAYKRFHSIAHLSATDLLSLDHLLLMHFFNRTPETMAAAIVTAQEIQRILIEIASKDFREPWRVCVTTPIEAAALQPFQFEGSVWDFFKLGMR